MKWVTVFLILSIHFANAQVNLVRNPGFEVYSKCPYDFEQIRLAIGWTPIDSNSISSDSMGNAICSPEYLNECSTSPYTSIPLNYYCYQYPHSGKGMASVYMYTDVDTTNVIQSLRDYLQGRLTKKLDGGKSYCVTFYVNLEEISGYAIKDIGAYLDNGSIDNTNYCSIPKTQYTPQVVNSNGIITDTADWTKIQGSFVANGTERFITIGNFKDRLHTTFSTIPINAINNGSNVSYYLIDDVSVIESDLPAFAGNDRDIGLGDSTYIGRPQEVGLECTWAKLGSSTVIGTGAGIWVKPNTTTSYVVTQTLCGAVKKDTVLVEVWPLGLSSVNGQTQDYIIAPNPNHGLVNLMQAVVNDEVMQAAVYNIVGQRVYEGNAVFKVGKANLQLPSLSNGVYYLQLQSKTGALWNKKLVKE